MKSRRRAYTLVEALIVLLIVVVISVLVVSILRSDEFAQKELLTRYNKTYADLEQIVQNASTLNDKRHILGSSPKGGFDFIKCSGSETQTQCLEKIFLLHSNALELSEQGIVNFEAVIDELNQLSPPLSTVKAQDFETIKLSSGAVIAMYYFDKTCKMNLEISKNAGGSEIIPNSCAILIADVNGDEIPNEYSANGENSDIFLFALQKDGIKGSKAAANGLAGCKNNETYSTDFGCYVQVRCPQGSMAVSEETEGAYKYKDMWGTYGYCSRGCPEGTELIGMTCSPTCKENEMRIDGACTSDKCKFPTAHWISTQAELEAIPDGTEDDWPEGIYCLKNDITLTYDTDTIASGGRISTTKGWRPIQNRWLWFYGKGHTIWNLYVNRPDEYYGGLIGHGGYAELDGLAMKYNSEAKTTPLALLDSLSTVINCHVLARDAAGAMGGGVGMPDVINNCHNEINVCTKGITGSGTVYSPGAGGLLGAIYTGSSFPLPITNSSNKGTIASIDKSWNRTGGLVGVIEGGDGNSIEVNSCHNQGLIIGGHAGGLFGEIEDYSGRVGIAKSYNIGTIRPYEGTSFAYLGGLVGNVYYLAEFSVSNSYNLGNITDTTCHYAPRGGILGRTRFSNKFSYNNVYQAGNISNTQSYCSNGDTIGGVVGYSEDLYSAMTFNLSDVYVLSQANYSKCYGAGVSWTAPQQNPSGCTFYNEAQIKSSTLYSTWSNLIWNVVDGSYPTLK